MPSAVLKGRGSDLSQSGYETTLPTIYMHRVGAITMGANYCWVVVHRMWRLWLAGGNEHNRQNRTTPSTMKTQIIS